MNVNTMGVFFKYTACVVAYKYKYEFMVLKALGIKHFILILVLVISSPTVWQIVCVYIVYQQCCCVRHGFILCTPLLQIYGPIDAVE